MEMQPTEERRINRANRRNQASNPEDGRSTTPKQRSFWQAITVGELETMKVLLERRDIDINKMDDLGEQRQGCSALHLAILEMPTWKTEGRNEGRNGIQTAEFVRDFFTVLLENGADIDQPCKYTGEWYLQTAAGKTKSFFPDGYDALGLVLQFVEITRGAEVISTNVTRRLELIRDLLLEHIKNQPEPILPLDCGNLSEDLSRAYREETYSDVTLLCEDEMIRAHRVILSARSPVFSKMFGNEFRESKQNEVVIEETDPIALRKFVQFLYEDRLDAQALSSDFDLCHSLIMLSNRYDVKALKVKCSEIILKSHLNVEKAAAILKLADENQVKNLRERTLNFILENGDSVRETTEFQKLDKDLLHEVIRSVFTRTPSSSLRRNVRGPGSSSADSIKRLRSSDFSDDDAVRAPPNNNAEEEDDDA